MAKSLRPYLWGLLALGVVAVINVAFGAVTIPPVSLGRMLAAQIPGLTVAPDWPETYATILFRIRLPHAVLIMLTGAALASSGAVYQGLFRNPLADPYLIGVASGAGLGAVIAMSLRWPQTLLGMYAVPAAAFLGAIITVAVVYNLARVGRAAPTSGLILAGIAVSAFAASLTSLLMLRSNEELRRAISWLLGGGTMTGWLPVFALLPYLAVGIGIILLSGYTLNVLQFGDEQAQQLGIAVERRKLLLVVAASLTTGAAVAFTGVIGFIGLIVPHIVRFIWGVDYRRILPLSLIGGAAALLFADVLARVLVSPEVLPLGIMTALAGGPFFLWIMRRSRGQSLI